MSTVTSAVLTGIYWLNYGLFFAVGLAGLVGVYMVLSTREDAFRAGDRQPKPVWAALLAVSATVLLLPTPVLSFLSWVGAVIIGIYWFDVRPQLKDLIAGRW